MTELTTVEKIIIAIDTANSGEAEKLVEMVQAAGGRYVKFGLQIATASSWQWCSQLAKRHGLQWIADAKFADIPNTIEAAIEALTRLAYPPYAVTVHTTIGHEAMRRAQAKAGQVKVFGVTVLTSLGEAESQKIYGSSAQAKVLELATAAARAGLAGIVASPLEVARLKQNPKTKHLLTMIPGSRSKTAETSDQARVATPAETMTAGADFLVIGREVTEAAEPAAALSKIVKDIDGR